MKTTSYKRVEKRLQHEKQRPKLKKQTEKKQKTKNNGTQKTPADNANSRIVTHHQTKRKFT